MRKLVFLILLIAILALTAGACVQGVSGPATVTVVSRTLSVDASGNAVLKVTVKNTGTVKADLAEIKATFYDARKEILDTGHDSIMGLAPGETWDFAISCNCTLNKIASYEVTATATN